MFKNLRGAYCATIENGNQQEIKEELGDFLFQVILQAQIAEDENNFSLLDVITTLATKMTLRHPHVFGKNKAKNLAEVWTNWEKIKKQEKLAKRKSSGTGSKAKDFSYFDFPKNLPALLYR